MQSAPALHLLHKQLAPGLQGPLAQIVILPLRADEADFPVSQLLQVLQSQRDAQRVVENHRIMLALPGGGVHKHQVGAQPRQGTDLVGLKQANGHDAVQLLPSGGHHKLTAPILQRHSGIPLIQTALAHKSTQIQVIRVVQLLHR